MNPTEEFWTLAGRALIILALVSPIIAIAIFD